MSPEAFRLHIAMKRNNTRGRLAALVAAEERPVPAAMELNPSPRLCSAENYVYCADREPVEFLDRPHFQQGARPRLLHIIEDVL